METTKPEKKPNTYRVYLNDEDSALMVKICQTTELGQSELLSKLMSAALRAVASNDCRITLPLRLKISEGEEKNDPRSITPKTTRR